MALGTWNNSQDLQVYFFFVHSEMGYYTSGPFKDSLSKNTGEMSKLSAE